MTVRSPNISSFFGAINNIVLYDLDGAMANPSGSSSIPGRVKFENNNFISVAYLSVFIKLIDAFEM